MCLRLTGLILLAGSAQWAVAGTPVDRACEPFAMEQVRLRPGPWQDAMLLNREYLLSFSVDSLLKNFRRTAGLPAPGEQLGGWEAAECEVRGHFVGHVLSATALMYASTGDARLAERARLLVEGMAEVQAAFGNGYLSAFPESHWDRVEAAQPNWAQYYTIHKIMAGLLDIHEYCHVEQALDVLCGQVGYFEARLSKLDQPQLDRVLAVTEEGGISDILWRLYAVTGDESHRLLAARLEKAAFLGPLALEHDNLTDRHGNTHIPLAIGAARHYELTGDERYRTVARFFWEAVVERRTFATGGTTLLEVWREPDRLADQLGYRNQECCKTHNLLKLTRHLFTWTASPRYADYYERALFNSIMGTQDPDTGCLMYYIPLADGFLKSVLSPHGHCYCCTGTGLESFAKLGDSIYFHSDDRLFVNLFISSELDWQGMGMRVVQETRFPDVPATELTVHCEAPVQATLSLRIPGWAVGGNQITVNGESLNAGDPAPGTYADVTRAWADGDRIELRLPMDVEAVPMPDDPELMAFRAGPMVLAGITAAASEPHPFRIPPGQEFPEHDRVPNHDFFLADPAEIDQWLTSAPDAPLTYTATAEHDTYRFVPFARITGERFRVYWPVTREGSERHRRILADAEERARLAEARERRRYRLLDHVVIGNSDSEAWHGLEGEGTNTGTHLGRAWRDASGWWQWRFSAVPGEMELVCLYWSGDRDRVFDVLVDGEVVAVEELTGAGDPGRFVERVYRVPAVTGARDQVTVAFRAHEGSRAGGVFDCELLSVAPVWNAAADYSTEHGVVADSPWTYGYIQGRPAAGNVFRPFVFSSPDHHMSLAVWAQGGGGHAQVQQSIKATSREVEFHGSFAVVLPEALYLAPSNYPDDEAPVLRWTCPETGDYRVLMRFRGAGVRHQGREQVTNSRAFLVHNEDRVLFEQEIDGFAGGAGRKPEGAAPDTDVIQRTVRCAAGDVLDIVVTANGTYGADHTAVDVIISSEQQSPLNP